MESRIVQSDIRHRAASLVIGSTIALAIIGCGVWLISIGHDLAGATLVICTLGTVLGSYIFSRLGLLEELAQKRRRMIGLPDEE